MDYLKKDDLFKVTETSLIGNDDVDIVCKLYQPLVGFKSLSLYLTLVNLKNIKNNKKHEYLYNLMQITPSDFLLSRKTLEAVGLLKTFKHNDNNLYIYQIFPPLSPKDFFNDYLFKGMIIKYLGDEIVLELANQYKINIDFKDYKEITTPFSEVFSFNLNDSTFNSSLLDKIKLKKNTPIQIIGEFSSIDLINRIKEKTNIVITSISDYEIKEIVRISTLYGIDLENIIPLIDECYDAKRKFGNKIDLNNLNKKSNEIVKYTGNKSKNIDLTPISISGKSKMADEFELICKVAPRDYLSYKQDGAPVGNSDLKIINILSDEYGLSVPIINVLIYYGLKTCNNVLSLNYLTKIAGSLKRAKITNPIDALNYFEGNKKGLAKPKKDEVKVNNSKKKEDLNNLEDDKELEEALKILRGNK